MRASEIARLAGGRLEGDNDPELTGVAPLDRAGPHELSFLAHAKYEAYVAATRAGAILTVEAPTRTTTPRIVVRDVYRALAAVLPALYPEAPAPPGVHPTAVIGRGAKLGRDVVVSAYTVIGRDAAIGDRARIGAHAVVGDACVLGEGVILHAHVTLYPRVRIGARSIVHAGVRLGVDGFGYVTVEGRQQKMPQVGSCVVGEDVEIGANTTIDRGSIGSTEIGDGTKIDNLVHIAHNVRVGRNSTIIAQVGIAGSTVVGERVTLAGQAGIQGHAEIGNGATVAAQAGVFGDIPAGAVYSGYPARPHQESLRAQAAVFRLPRLVQRIRALERAILGRGNTEA